MNRISENDDFSWCGARVMLFCISLFVFIQSPAQTKTLQNTTITIHVKARPLQDVLSLIEIQVPFTFAYNTELIRQQKNITLSFEKIPLSDLLTNLFQGSPLTYTLIGNEIALRNITPLSKITLNGFCRDSRSGELLIGATVSVPADKIGVNTNSYGFYSITVPPADSLELEISYVGYKSIHHKWVARDEPGIFFNMDHNDAEEQIAPLILIVDKREDNVKKIQPAVIELSSDMILSSPSVLGSGDLISSIEMLPGVQAGMDGIPGYIVRGGNTGQNLVLLDEATLYNPSHALGLVSIFNPPAIKNAVLMKGGFPASYGDHLSSVLDVSMKDGSNQKFGGMVQLGTLASGITIYGPLQEGKSSFLVSARRSMVDLLLQPFLKQNYFRNYYFYDLNGKINFQFGRNDRLFLSMYAGMDYNNYVGQPLGNGGINYSMHFGNSAFSMRWNHVFSNKLFSNTALIYSQYQQFLSATRGDYFAQLYSGIRDINLKTDLSYYHSPTHKINAGADYLFQTLLPASLSQKISASNNSRRINPAVIPEKNATRVAVYLSDDIKISSKFKAYAGLRVPVYLTPDTFYVNLEPRFSLLYLINPATSLKFSYTQMHQYLHLVQSYNASFPAEIWIGSSSLTPPQASREISVGIFKNIQDNIFQTSLEFYYKVMDNQLLFKGGTTLGMENNIEDHLIYGKGWSYGTELFIRKNRGRLTGWLAYSFAFAYQQFDSLNLGQPFPFAFDRRQVLDISTAYSISEHWKISGNLVIASGRPNTMNTYSKTSGSSQDNNPLYNDENSNGTSDNGTPIVEPNNYRIQPYDRLDLALSYKKTKVRGPRILETEWIFSVYNVYSRQNPFFVYRTIDPATRQVVANEVAFIPIIPSITYSLKF